MLTEEAIPSLYSVRVTKLTYAITLTVFILGAVPASLILTDLPAATAAPMWAQEPLPGPQLSAEEQEALDRKKSGQPLTEAQKKAAKSAQEKQKTQDKYNGERNQQKQRGGPRRR
jgi:hypothetical protein